MKSKLGTEVNEILKKLEKVQQRSNHIFSKELCEELETAVACVAYVNRQLKEAGL